MDGLPIALVCLDVLPRDEPTMGAVRVHRGKAGSSDSVHISVVEEEDLLPRRPDGICLTGRVMREIDRGAAGRVGDVDVSVRTTWIRLEGDLLASAVWLRR